MLGILREIMNELFPIERFTLDCFYRISCQPSHNEFTIKKIQVQDIRPHP